MDLRIFVEPQQGATYVQQLAVARAAERLGFDAFFRSDHYLHMSGDGLPGPTDSWVTLGAIARRYGTTVGAIQRFNGLRGSRLRVGQALRIPVSARGR